MKTANLAIVFTDIKGFTAQTSRQTLGENERLLDTHARLLTPLFQSFGGRIVKSIGDAFMVTFESPTNAVLSGVAIQDRLWLHNRQVGEAERFEVRVAINVGEVRLDHRDVFGEPVNIAARVEGMAEVGEVYFTEAVYLAMNKAEVPSVELGAFELKGIPGKVKIFKVPRAPYRVEAPAGEASAEAPPFGNLGLSRVKDADLRGSMAGAAGVLGARAAAMGEEIVERTQRGLSRLRWRTVVALLAVLAVAAAAFAMFGRSDLDRAIASVESAPEGEERDRRTSAAEALIAQVQEPADRAWHRGRLLEALGREGLATQSYRDAATRGSSRAERRLIDLLEHPRCAMRSAAAAQLGSLRLESARRALEGLAEKGGADDQSGGGVFGSFFGCNSKDAAARALQRLGKPPTSE
jgi:adenylate cyclase